MEVGRADPEGTSQSREQVAQMPFIPIPALTAFTLPARTYSLVRDSLRSKDGKDKTQAWFTGGSEHQGSTTQKQPVTSLLLLSGASLWDSGKGIM